MVFKASPPLNRGLLNFLFPNNLPPAPIQDGIEPYDPRGRFDDFAFMGILLFPPDEPAGFLFLEDPPFSTSILFESPTMSLVFTTSSPRLPLYSRATDSPLIDPRPVPATALIVFSPGPDIFLPLPFRSSERPRLLPYG